MRRTLTPPSKTILSILRTKHHSPRAYATITPTPTTPTPSLTSPLAASSPEIPPSSQIRLHPSTQPPTHKPAQFRKTQLLRQYASLLHSTPLTLLFQHNNLRAVEWIGLRRELSKAMLAVDKSLATSSSSSTTKDTTPSDAQIDELASGIRIQIVQTGIFAAALRIVEYYAPAATARGEGLQHVLSSAAHAAVYKKSKIHPLAPLLSGPIALVTFPAVSPEHLRAAISILAPSAPDFKAPTRKANAAYYDDAVQNGLQKLMFLGARVDGRVFDYEGTKGVGRLDGLAELRARLVQVLQGVGAGVTNTLDSAAKNLWFTMESRRTQLEDEAKTKES